MQNFRKNTLIRNRFGRFFREGSVAELFVQRNCNLMVPGASHLTCYPPDLLPLSPSLTPLLSIVNIQQIGLLLTGHFARSMLFFFLSFFVLVIISIIILFLKEKKKRTRYKWNTPLLTCKQRRLLRYLYFAVPKKTR